MLIDHLQPSEQRRLQMVDFVCISWLEKDAFPNRTQNREKFLAGRDFFDGPQNRSSAIFRKHLG